MSNPKIPPPDESPYPTDRSDTADPGAGMTGSRPGGDKSHGAQPSEPDPAGATNPSNTERSPKQEAL